ncbi:unnamed protein product [Heligmosomoides polygyrus]|uniref:Uncharacterized protein n=1 Tax=Heligmosomoides polygyrus TaxID=6339 RepID=A0A183G7Z5_HELPZ|nr:unnamed protein product [Heligmosomoides polygyrus]
MEGLVGQGGKPEPGTLYQVKHEPACKKLSKLNRKPFDSGKQRATGSDITYADVKRAQKEREKMGGIYPRPQTNWKERHETFIDAVSSSKKVDYAIKTGAPLPPPPRTAVPSDYPIPSPDAFSDESCSWVQDENRDCTWDYEQGPNPFTNTIHGV